MIEVRVPATSANLGPGFDCMGLALGLYNTVYFAAEGSGLEISGCDPRFAGPNNLTYQAFVRTLQQCGAEVPQALKIHIESNIPVSRGLGSSAAMIVAGILGANALCNLGLSEKEMLQIAAAMEGHPDNAAPCIFGGLTAAFSGPAGPVCARYKVSDSLRFTVFVPDFELSTEKARSVLPDTVPRKDAVYTLGCLALLLQALETGDKELLNCALDDRLHQPFRKDLIPGYEDVRKLSLQNGAAGFVISGSGSTLLAVGGDENFEKRMQAALSDLPGNWNVLGLKVEQEGARCRTII